MDTVKAYEEVVDFIAGGVSSSDIADFGASDAAKKRVADLIHRGKTIGLSPDEESELNHYTEVEHLMRLAKARAREYVGVK